MFKKRSRLDRSHIQIAITTQYACVINFTSGRWGPDFSQGARPLPLKTAPSLQVVTSNKIFIRIR